MRRTVTSAAATAIAVVLGGGSLTACMPSRPDPTPIRATSPTTPTAPTQASGGATKSFDGVLKTDPAPLVKRFPAIGTPTSVAWASGVMGDPRVPGPSTYWIDAVVEVTPEGAALLRAAATSGGVGEGQPEVVPLLADRMPAGPLRTSPALDALLSSPGWDVHGYVDPAVDVLVLTAVGEG